MDLVTNYGERWPGSWRIAPTTLRTSLVLRRSRTAKLRRSVAAGATPMWWQPRRRLRLLTSLNAVATHYLFILFQSIMSAQRKTDRPAADHVSREIGDSGDDSLRVVNSDGECSCPIARSGSVPPSHNSKPVIATRADGKLSRMKRQASSGWPGAPAGWNLKPYPYQ